MPFYDSISAVLSFKLQVTPEMMPELAKQAQAAIAQGKQAITDYNHSLERLKLANPQPNRLPWGF